MIPALFFLALPASEPTSQQAASFASDVDLACPPGTAPMRQVTQLTIDVFCANTDTRERHGPFHRSFASGRLNVEGRYYFGKKAGLWRTYYESGRLEAEGHYDDDAPAGSWTYWHESGPKKLEGGYELGHRQGPWTEYYESGQRKSLRFYEEGALARGGTEWDEEGKERPVGHARVHLSFGMQLGWTAIATMAELERTPPLVQHRFQFGGRPELLFTPRMADVGLGVYVEALTNRSFQDVALGSGALMRFGTHAIKVAPWVGAYARAFLGRWEPGITAGVFVGIHDHKNIFTMASGLRLDLRHTFGRDQDFSLTLGVQLDLTLLMLPVMIVKGIPWFPR